MSSKNARSNIFKGVLEQVKETAQDLSDIALQQQAPPGTPQLEKEKKDDEYVLPEPNTESVPPSPVTGQTADESQDKPGQ